MIALVLIVIGIIVLYNLFFPSPPSAPSSRSGNYISEEDKWGNKRNFAARCADIGYNSNKYRDRSNDFGRED